jgi:hypothetical protein
MRPSVFVELRFHLTGITHIVWRSAPGDAHELNCGKLNEPRRYGGAPEETASRVMPGGNCLRSSSDFALKPYANNTKPLALPPGLEWLSRYPAPIGSATQIRTIGTRAGQLKQRPVAALPRARMKSSEMKGQDTALPCSVEMAAAVRINARSWAQWSSVPGVSRRHGLRNLRYRYSAKDFRVVPSTVVSNRNRARFRANRARLHQQHRCQTGRHDNIDAIYDPKRLAGLLADVNLQLENAPLKSQR